MLLPRSECAASRGSLDRPALALTMRGRRAGALGDKSADLVQATPRCCSYLLLSLGSRATRQYDDEHQHSHTSSSLLIPSYWIHRTTPWGWVASPSRFNVRIRQPWLGLLEGLSTSIANGRTGPEWLRIPGPACRSPFVGRPERLGVPIPVCGRAGPPLRLRSGAACYGPWPASDSACPTAAVPRATGW